MGGSILVFGSTCVDVLIRVPRLPNREEDLQPAGQRFTMGGCAYNAACVPGRNGADVTFVTPVGLRGVFGPYLLERLRALPWADPVPLPEGENGCCYCLVEPDGERTFLSVHGVEYSFDPAWMEKYRHRHFDWGYVCGLELEEPTGETLAHWMAGADIGRILFAPGPRLERIHQARAARLLACSPILHLNRAEALRMAGTGDLRAAAAGLFAMAGSPVVVTLGAEGAAVTDADGLRVIPPCPVERVADTVGAGDAHAGGLLLGLSRGLALDEAVALANRAAAAAVMTEGAAPELCL